MAIGYRRDTDCGGGRQAEIFSHRHGLVSVLQQTDLLAEIVDVGQELEQLPFHLVGGGGVVQKVGHLQFGFGDIDVGLAALNFGGADGPGALRWRCAAFRFCSANSTDCLANAT